VPGGNTRGIIKSRENLTVTEHLERKDFAEEGIERTQNY
jgi:hypothetical protein